MYLTIEKLKDIRVLVEKHGWDAVIDIMEGVLSEEQTKPYPTYRDVGGSPVQVAPNIRWSDSMTICGQKMDGEARNQSSSAKEKATGYKFGSNGERYPEVEYGSEPDRKNWDLS